MGFASEIDRIAERMSRDEMEKKELCEAVRKMRLPKISGESLSEEDLIKKVGVSDMGKSVLAAVDGGLAAKSFHGIDILLLRAVGVVFSYSGGRLESCDYHPGPLVEPVPRVYYEPFHDTEFDATINMERQAGETARAMEVVEKFRPHIMFMHGSIVPQYTNAPGKDSLLHERFERMMTSYIKLFESCERNNVILAGVVEDSRGSRFCDVLKGVVRSTGGDERLDAALGRMKDSILLSAMLGFGERTLAFGYSSRPQENQILRRLGRYSSSVKCFYVRNAEHDRPVRVEFLGVDGNPSDIADRISSTLINLSRNSMYAMPPMIVEADQRAKMSDADMDFFCSALTGRLGNLAAFDELRRAQRPF